MRVLGLDADPLRALGPVERAVLAAEILGTYVSVRVLLRRRGFQRTVERVRGPVGGTVADDAEQHRRAATGRRLGHAVARTLSRLPLDSRCLVQSLVLTRLLARRGIDSALVIGVRRGPEFGAHAWVEAGRVALLPTHGATFDRLAEL